MPLLTVEHTTDDGGLLVIDQETTTGEHTYWAARDGRILYVGSHVTSAVAALDLDPGDRLCD